MHSSILENYVTAMIDFMPEEISVDVVRSSDSADENEASSSSYIFLLEDSKLFWRTKDTFHISLYIHSKLNCLEVVLQNVKSVDETPLSLYFDYNLLYQL